MPEKQTELILTIHMNESQTYDGKTRGHFSAYVQAMAEGARDYEAQPMTTLYSYESLWARFAMNAYYGNMTLSEGYAYGFEYGYEPDYNLVTTKEIDRFSKGLKKVERSIAKRCEANGRPQSLGQEVVYVMQALGITKACWKQPEGRPGGEYRDWRVVRSMEDVRYHIDSTIAACRQKQLDEQAA